MELQWVAEYAIWGGIGGFVAVVAKQGCFELPYVKDRRLYFGGLQGIVFGIIAGLIGDSSSMNALMWGVGGTSIIQGIVRVAETNAACWGKKDAKGG